MRVRPSIAWRGAAALLLGASEPAVAQDPTPNAPAREARIVVTGTTTPVTLEKIGSSLTVIDGAEIERSRSASLHDLLRRVPGLAVSQSGSFGSPAQVRIRGAEGNHTLVLIDGIEVSPIGEGEFDFSSLLAGNIDRVEILRGPQSGLYGSNALGGVINVITRGGEGPLFDTALEGGSFGTLMGRGALTIGNRATFLSASGIFRSTDGFSTAAIGSEADGDRNATAYLRGGLAISPIARLDGSFRFVDKETEADGFDFSGGPNQGLAIDDGSFSDTQEVSGGLALSLTPTENLTTVFTGAYTDYEMVGGSGGTGTFGNVGDRLKLGGRLTLSFGTGEGLGHALTAFADFENEAYRNTYPFDPSQVPEQRRDLLGLGAEYRLDLFDALFLSAALRHDDNSRFADATTYSLTASWGLESTGTRLHASYGKGVTNPTFFEQFGFTPGEFVGNPNLLPEEAKGFDIGIEQRFGGAVLLDLTYFNSTLRDEIVSQFPSVANDLGESDREGVEAAARADLGWLRLGAAYTYLSAADPDDTSEVRRPEHQASFDASGDFGPERRGNLNLGVLFNGEMLDTDFRDFFTDFRSRKTALDDYIVVRLAGSYRITRALELFGRVENLFDDQYQEVISYATPGLSAYGGVRLVIP